ncbi:MULTISPECIES: family 1 glycosylhydrolase [unclassified Microbacterium]|nr:MULTISPECIES: family 1 glycosylhydrolase [unclassified Microbacterium]
MQHYRFWERDLNLCEDSGATLLRWGIPWYRVNPEKGQWDWSWLDRIIDWFDEHRIDLVADLIHYGTPLWLKDEFVSRDYPERVAEYAATVAERYRGRIRHYTPANEPLLNVMYCGEFGHWPPYLTGDKGFTSVLKGISQGIVHTQRAIAEMDPAADFVHVEASFRFDGDLDAHAETIEHLRHRAYVVQDLVTGRVDDDHPLVPYLRANGFTDDDFAWARANTAQPDVVGVNYYPQHSTELFEKGVVLGGGPGSLRPRRNAGTAGLKDVLTTFADRYDKPVFLTETGYTGTVQERIDWLHASVGAVDELRADGVDVVGYTWWCITDMFEWTYRHSDGPAMDHLLRMGLWALEEDADGVLQRVHTPVADVFRDVATRRLG